MLPVVWGGLPRTYSMPSFFSCLVDCAGFDLVDDCVATPRPGEHIRGSQSSQQARRTPHHTTEALETDASSDSLSLSSDSTIIEGFSGGRRKAAVSPSDCPAPSSWSSSEQVRCNEMEMSRIHFVAHVVYSLCSFISWLY